MSTPEKDSGISIGSILGVISAATAGAFVFGFLVVNIYLSSFGSWDFSFLRVEDIAAGILFFLFFGFTFMLAFTFFKINDSLNQYLAKQKSDLKKYKYYAVVGGVYILKAIIYIALGIFNFWVLNLFIGNGSASPSFTIGILTVWFLFITIAASSGLKLYQKIYTFHPGFESIRIILSEWMELFQGFLVFLLLFVTVLMFSTFMYPFIPRAFGGGTEANVIIYLKQNTNLISPLPAKLIYESSDFLLINASGSTFSLPSDQVNDIQYIDSFQGFQNFLNAVQAPQENAGSRL